MSERLQRNESNCMDFVAEITNHPFIHKIESSDSAWLVPQMRNEEVLQDIVETIPVTEPPLLFLDNISTRPFRSDNLNTTSVQIAQDSPLYRVMKWLYDTDGLLFAGDFVGLKDEDDLDQIVRSNNLELLASVGSIGVIGGGIIARLAYHHNRARARSTNPKIEVADPSRRKFLMIGAAAAALCAVGTFGSYSWIVNMKTNDVLSSDGCISGSIPFYRANVLPRNVAVTTKMNDILNTSNKHAVWGSAHVLETVVAETRVQLLNPSESLTNAVVYEAQFINNKHSQLSLDERSMLLSRFVVDMTTSMTLKPYLLADGSLGLIPLSDSRGNSLQYHPDSVPNGLDQYNPVSSNGSLRQEAYINYASDVLQRV